MWQTRLTHPKVPDMPSPDPKPNKNINSAPGTGAQCWGGALFVLQSAFER